MGGNIRWETYKQPIFLSRKRRQMFHKHKQEKWRKISNKFKKKKKMFWHLPILIWCLHAYVLLNLMFRHLLILMFAYLSAILMSAHLPIINFDVCICDWVIHEPHEMEVQHRRKWEKHNTLLGFLAKWSKNITTKK